ncbi:MAG: helix-turn-helix transcriptional regulator [Actinomycetota bacterium]|nr:helix-turn-helix transcriptional regulator [Actinomycetota bacterium]
MEESFPEPGLAMLGELVYGMRRAKGWSRRQLSEISGLDPDTIANVEMAAHLPRRETLRRMGLALVESDAPWEAPKRALGRVASLPAADHTTPVRVAEPPPARDGLVLVSRTTVTTTETWSVMAPEVGDGVSG